MKSWVVSSFKTVMVTMLMLNVFDQSSAFAAPKSELQNQTIRGNSGGPIDSKNCGFVAATPSYTVSLSERMDYMRILVETNGGQPTLLIIGPKAEDSFCVLGDMNAGLKPEISGVWEPGTYQVYVGDRSGRRHRFTLNISTDKN